MSHSAYMCMYCNTVHGWQNHPNVMLVKTHIRDPWEDIWHCPSCDKEHRTSHGQRGMLSKMHERIEFDNLDAVEESFKIYLSNNDFISVKREGNKITQYKVYAMGRMML